MSREPTARLCLALAVTATVVLLGALGGKWGTAAGQTAGPVPTALPADDAEPVEEPTVVPPSVSEFGPPRVPTVAPPTSTPSPAPTETAVPTQSPVPTPSAEPTDAPSSFPTDAPADTPTPVVASPPTATSAPPAPTPPPQLSPAPAAVGTPLPADAPTNADSGGELRRGAYLWVVIPALLALVALGFWWLRRLPG